MSKKMCILMIYLGILALFDIREKRVPVILPFLGTAAGIVWRIYRMSAAKEPSVQIWSMCVALLPGLLMLAAAKWTGKAGWGDGWILLNIGLVTDYSVCVAWWGMSMFVMALFCAVLLLFRKAQKDSRVPYLPFVALTGCLFMQ